MDTSKRSSQNGHSSISIFDRSDAMSCVNRCLDFAKVTPAKVVCLVISITLIVGDSRSSFAVDTTDRLRTSVARMNHWLGTGSKARKWRSFLDLNVLESQVAKGEQADPYRLRLILSRFEIDHASLEHPVFEAVRSSLRGQIEQIEQTQTIELSNLQWAAREAIKNYKPLNVEQIRAERDEVVNELQLLKEFYRRDYPSGMRAIEFRELGLQETIEVLMSLEPEKPAKDGKRSGASDDDLPDSQPFKLEKVFPVFNELKAAEDVGSESIERKRRREAALKLCDARERFRQKLNLLDGPGLGLALESLLFRKITDWNEDIIEEAISGIGTDPALAAAYQSIDRFVATYWYAMEDIDEDEFKGKLQELSNLIPDLQIPQRRDSHARIGAILAWLESRHQLPDLCTAIRRKYSKPNLYISVSGNLLHQVKLEVEPISEYIKDTLLGRLARGVASATATVSIVPVENPDQVQIAVLVNGTASTNAYVRQRKIKVSSSGSGTLFARLDALLGFSGLEVGPAVASANMTNQFGGICTPSGILERFEIARNAAREMFDELLPQANAEASQRAKEMLDEQLQDEIGKYIDPATKYVEIATSKLREFSAQLPPTFLRSTSLNIEAVVKHEGWNLGSTSDPIFQPAGSDIQMKIHESFINNYLDQYYSGREDLTLKEWRNQAPADGTSGEGTGAVQGIDTEIGDLTGSRPSTDIELLDDLSLSFRGYRPIQLTFEADLVGITFHCTKAKLERDGEDTREIGKSFSVDLKYKIVLNDETLFLQAVADPKISYDNRKAPDDEFDDFAVFLEDWIKTTYEKPALPSNVLIARELLEDEESEAGEKGEDVDRAKIKLDLDSFKFGLIQLQGGWLSVGWNWKQGVVNTSGIEFRNLETESDKPSPESTSDIGSVLELDFDSEPEEVLAPEDSGPATDDLDRSTDDFD